MVPAVLVSFFASQAILHNIPQLQISFTHPGVARAVLGGAVYVMLVGIFALAIGAIVRNTAGGIATFAAIFFVLPPLMFTLPHELEQRDQPVPAERRRPAALRPPPRVAHADAARRAASSSSRTAPPRSLIAAVLLVRRDV